MPTALFCFHSYGKWSKFKNGKRSRTCLKCKKTQKQDATFLDQLFCWHKYGRNRKNPVIRCFKCGKVKP